MKFSLPEPVETPLVRTGGLWVKPEGGQLTGSVKFRMVRAKLRAAFLGGRIAPGTTLTEVTSGSTGVALAWAGQCLGLPVELHAYRSIRPEKRAAIERAGANLVLHELDRPVAELLARVEASARDGRFWHLGQYDRVSVTEAYGDLAAELIRQLEGKEPPRTFLCPVGTGGIIQGVGSRLRAAFPGIRVVALEPLPEASIEGTRNTARAHLGKGDPYDTAFPDEVARVAAPARRVNLNGTTLGESASAAFDLAQARGYPQAVLIAPD